MNKSADQFFLEGCGRCPLGGTPDCKFHSWTTELAYLRKIVLDCGLTEQAKWGFPCYTFQGNNLLMISVFNDYCCISFFKGVLLQDEKNLLVKPGPNSQATRLLKFNDIHQIESIEKDIKAYIFESIELEKAGIKVQLERNPEPIPTELQAKFEEDPPLKSAFEALTPGRQRGYILHFSQPKQTTTRISRIEKCTPMILSGIGLHDHYRARNK